MASKRAIKNRPKDFDVLLNEYLQSHPPKNLPKAVSAVVTLDLMNKTAGEPADLSFDQIEAHVPFCARRPSTLYISVAKRNAIANHRSIMSFLDRSRANKVSRPL